MLFFMGGVEECSPRLFFQNRFEYQVVIKSTQSEFTCAGIGGSDYTIADIQSWLRRQHLIVTTPTKDC